MYIKLNSRFLPLTWALVLSAVTPGTARINLDLNRFNKTTAFIYNADSSGEHADTNAPRGTGFFVQVPLVSDPKQAYKMLVTARHVVDPEWAHCAATNPTKLFLRLNTKNYDPEKDATGVGLQPAAASRTFRAAFRGPVRTSSSEQRSQLAWLFPDVRWAS